MSRLCFSLDVYCKLALNPVRAVGLFSRAIEEAGHVGSMMNLAGLLEHGAEGVEANPVRAVELLTRAIDEGGGESRLKMNHDVIQKDVAEGVMPTATRVI